ncbi:hypothetical protein EJ08DRAFT_662930 [Tothia fuscella]|uniref:Uncharacterized protein n=1 Tax=Tothia fuscella TaxID=1048955 RepID=A0A9P4NM59_9PEZI|nr:hypothetical protein EJ08DRAFT_662930 [Tothia fuscella]
MTFANLQLASPSVNHGELADFRVLSDFCGVLFDIQPSTTMLSSIEALPTEVQCMILASCHSLPTLRCATISSQKLMDAFRGNKKNILASIESRKGALGEYDRYDDLKHQTLFSRLSEFEKFAIVRHWINAMESWSAQRLQWTNRGIEVPDIAQHFDKEFKVLDIGLRDVFNVTGDLHNSPAAITAHFFKNMLEPACKNGMKAQLTAQDVTTLRMWNRLCALDTTTIGEYRFMSYHHQWLWSARTYALPLQVAVFSYCVRPSSKVELKGDASNEDDANAGILSKGSKERVCNRVLKKAITESFWDTFDQKHHFLLQILTNNEDLHQQSASHIPGWRKGDTFAYLRDNVNYDSDIWDSIRAQLREEIEDRGYEYLRGLWETHITPCGKNSSSFRIQFERRFGYASNC